MMKKQNNTNEKIRVRNPFLDPLVTELIDDPDMYRRVFSERILVGATLHVFQPVNSVLLGPQGSGKSMILNLIRYKVLSNWMSNNNGALPAPLKHIPPFLGISMNLTRANFHAFGRRSFAISNNVETLDEKVLGISSAADFLNQYLFREFLYSLEHIVKDGKRLKEWLKLRIDEDRLSNIVNEIATWDCWFGYYEKCDSLESLIDRCDERLKIWTKYLNANIDNIPSEIWKTKTEIGTPIHKIGNLLSKYSDLPRLPIYIILDQYEVLPELNKAYGTELQRLVNSLIKSRDPVVYIKLGARTYDWGEEVRIWGSESRIEVQRDYVVVDLSDVLMRQENEGNWLFPTFAQDVAYKRIHEEGRFRFNRKDIEGLFGSVNVEKESWQYFKNNKERRYRVISGLTKSYEGAVKRACGEESSPLELRLASAWTLQRVQRKDSQKKIISQMKTEPVPWKRSSWSKERKLVALFQIASIANQRKFYYGWETLTYLSGGNITAFLLICNEIWDVATRLGYHPLRNSPLLPEIQTEGIYNASEKWHARDRNEKIGGAHRYEVLGRLGPAISKYLKSDLAISNPGHSGFSLRESELWSPSDENTPNAKVAKFLHDAVSWAILEERPHTSKNKESASRRKWYLHPLLSPVFDIPFKRVKEPFYTDINVVYSWIFDQKTPNFGINRKTKKDKLRRNPSNQLKFQFGGQ